MATPPAASAFSDFFQISFSTFSNIKSGTRCRDEGFRELGQVLVAATCRDSARSSQQCSGRLELLAEQSGAVNRFVVAYTDREAAVTVSTFLNSKPHSFLGRHLSACCGCGNCVVESAQLPSVNAGESKESVAVQCCASGHLSFFFLPNSPGLQSAAVVTRNTPGFACSVDLLVLVTSWHCHP